MNLIERNNCILTGLCDLEYLYTFKEFPFFMGCTEDGAINDVKPDMIWNISRNTGIIQLKNLIPLDLLYKKSHGAGVVGKLWSDHHFNFSKFILNFEMNNVLEIGGGHNKLSNNVLEVRNNIDWTIIDPNVDVKNISNKINVIDDFFDDTFSSDKDFDTIIFSHLIEHIYDPNVFIGTLLRIIKNGTHLLFSVPNMKEMLKNKYTNCLNFEHTLFLTEPYIEYLFDKYGFKLLLKEEFMEDHSFFYAYEFDENHVKTIELDNYYEENKKIFFEYVNHYHRFVKEINDNIEKSNYDEIYLFGAHIFSQYLISFGLNTNNVLFIIDNDINKQGKRLYGTDLYVKSPKILIDKKNTLVILCAGFYNDEIKKDILSINKNINIIEIL